MGIVLFFLALGFFLCGFEAIELMLHKKGDHERWAVACSVLGAIYLAILAR